MPIDLNTLGSETENDKVVNSALAGASAQVPPAPSLDTTRAIANVGAARMGEPPAVPSPDKYEGEEGDRNFFNDISIGALDNGFIVGGIKSAAEFSAADDAGLDRTIDIGFAPKNLYDADPEAKTRLDAMRDSATNSGLHYWQQFYDAPNEQVARYVLGKWDDHQANRKEVEDSDLLAYSMGLVGSLAIDTVAAVLTGSLAGVGRAVTTQTAAGSRFRAGARVAGFGAAEGAAERAAQGLTNKDIGLEDILVAAGFGAGAGAFLGGVAPKFVGNVLSKEAEATALLKHANSVKAARQAAAGDGMGAAATLSDDGLSVMDNVVPTTGTGSAVVGKVVPNALRSPKRLAMDMSIRGAELKEKFQLLGSDMFGAIMNRTYKRSTLTETDLDGIAAQDTIQMALHMDEETLIAHNAKQHETYTGFVRNIMGKGAGAQAVTNDYLLSNTLGRAIKTNIPPKEELRNYAALISQAKGEIDQSIGPSLSAKAYQDVIEHVENKLRGRVPDDKLEETMDIIQSMGKLDDKFYEAWGLREINAGKLKPEELKPGYRPQVWNTEEIEANPIMFENMLAERLGADAKEEWVNDNFQREMTAEEKAAYDEANPDRAKRSVPGSAAAGTAATQVADYPQVPLLQGRTIDDLKKSEPSLYQAIVDEWDEGRIAENSTRLEAAAKNLESELARFQGKTQREVFAQMNRRLDTADKTIREATNRLDKMKAGDTELQGEELQAALDRDSLRISRAEMRRDEINRQYDELRIALDTHTNVEKVLRASIKTKSTRDELDQLLKKHRKAERKVAASNARKLITEITREVKDKLLKGEGPNGKAPGGFITDGLVQNSSYFKHRSINLSGVRHRDEWQRFLRNDQEMNMEMYNNAVGRQVAISESFNPWLTARGVEIKDGKTLDAVKKELENAYAHDRGRLEELGRNGTLTKQEMEKQLKALTKRSREELNFFDRAFGEITKSDYLSVLGDDTKKAWDRLASTAQAATAASTLGNLLFAQFTDLALLTWAGTKMGTGWASMFNRMWKRGTLKEIGKSDFDTASIIRGGNIQSMGHYINRMDMDSPSADVPGGFLSTVQRTVQSVAVAEGWANLAQVSNRFIRSSFGMDFANQIIKDFNNYENLGKTVVGFYAKHGVGREEVMAMRELLNKHNITVNGIAVPDGKKWGLEPGGDRLFRKYKQLVIGAGHEAMLDPGIGDAPFLRRFAMGRLALQFQRFTYKAGNEYFAPMIQSMMINKVDVKAMASIVMALSFATAANYARMYASGNGDKADASLKKLDEGDASEFWDVVKTGWLRSPMAVGFSGTAADMIGTTLAPSVNSAWKGATGSDFKPLNEEWVRLRQGQGLFALAGPTVGLANTAYKTATRGLEGDMDHVQDMAWKRLPIANVMPLHVLALTLKKAFGDD